jgi:hypothetical protein
MDGGVLDHWMNFSRGICSKGNFADAPRSYIWEDFDQPGAWYALTKTNQEFFPEYATNQSVCNDTLCIVNTLRAYGPELNIYFRRVGAKWGVSGLDLLVVPSDQPSLRSKSLRFILTE